MVYGLRAQIPDPAATPRPSRTRGRATWNSRTPGRSHRVPEPSSPSFVIGRYGDAIMTTDRRVYEYPHLVTFADTNVAGNVYFAHFVSWQGKVREELLCQVYPDFPSDMRRGFSMITE